MQRPDVCNPIREVRFEFSHQLGFERPDFYALVLRFIHLSQVASHSAEDRIAVYTSVVASIGELGGLAYAIEERLPGAFSITVEKVPCPIH